MATPPLAGKVALVTGGSRGLGRAAALALAARGADVILTYRSAAAAAAATVRDVEGHGRRAVALRADLTGDSAAALVAAVAATLDATFAGGRLDILVNNAGINSQTPFPGVTLAELNRVFQVNYAAPYLLTQGLLPRMADGGRIVFVGSGTSRFVVPPMSAYGPLKAAVECLARYVAAEVGDRGITANAVAPGMLATEFNKEGMATRPEVTDHIAGMTALGRIGEPTDVAGVIAFLCSPDAQWVNGQRIEVAGGIYL
ncbi:hypothetical protein I4F81_008265 [Pyropia yezoensis]|uniref:Uncharacterized protein n=1 Tax=Pyropia yezoensis TaxID=2788 RepID=A0ACC3C697_PYRYE|nr:hypothetical protein I4F81_008265 [Neopyropia yezoensis]